MLHDLVVAVWRAEDIRAYARRHAIDAWLPGEVGLAALASDFVDLLQRRGMVDAELFDALAKTAPKRSAEIAQVAVAWDIAWTPPAVPPSIAAQATEPVRVPVDDHAVPDLFLALGGSQRAAAVEVADLLRRRGWRVRLDADLTDQDWTTGLTTWINTARAIVVLLPSDWPQAKWLRHELPLIDERKQAGVSVQAFAEVVPSKPSESPPYTQAWSWRRWDPARAQETADAVHAVLVGRLNAPEGSAQGTRLPLPKEPPKVEEHGRSAQPGSAGSGILLLLLVVLGFVASTEGRVGRWVAELFVKPVPISPTPAPTPLVVTPMSEVGAADPAPTLTPSTKIATPPLKLLSGGTFQMGSPVRVGAGDERPQHAVTVSGFYIGITEVTQSEWRSVALAGEAAGITDAVGLHPDPSRFDNSTAPVEQVSWCDTVRWLNVLSELRRREGESVGPVYKVSESCESGSPVSVRSSVRGYRLPTEAEWEYAARAGCSADHCGEAGSPIALSEAGWFDDNADSTRPVGGKTANPWGLFDTAGNAWEWTGDWYDADYYASSPIDNPMGPAQGAVRVIRGCCYGSSAGRCRPAVRASSLPGSRDSNLGFRVAVSAVPTGGGR